MSLIDIHVDLGRVADALEKIARLLEGLVTIENSPKQDVKVHQATLDDLRTTSEEDVANMQADQWDFAERFGVVPGSPAQAAALVDWVEQQRSIHGDKWQAPKKEEWRAIFAAAHRDLFREPTGDSGPADRRSRSKAAENRAR